MQSYCHGWYNIIILKIIILSINISTSKCDLIKRLPYSWIFPSICNKVRAWSIWFNWPPWQNCGYTTKNPDRQWQSIWDGKVERWRIFSIINKTIALKLLLYSHLPLPSHLSQLGHLTTGCDGVSILSLLPVSDMDKGETKSRVTAERTPEEGLKAHVFTWRQHTTKRTNILGRLQNRFNIANDMRGFMEEE